jgi:hypothetical protein
MITLIMFTLRLIWWSVAISIDLLFLIFTLGKVDLKVRKML